VELSVSPRVEDAINEFFIRVPVRLTYGLTERWEISASAGTFVDNPAQGESRSGISDVTLFTKYRFRRFLREYVASALAMSVLIPVGSNEDISGGYTRYTPRFIVSKLLPGWHNVELAGSVAVAFLAAPQEGADPDARDVLSVSGSFIYPRGRLQFFLESFWNTDRIDGGDDDRVFLTPGIQWDMNGVTSMPVVRRAKSLAVGIRVGLGDDAADIALVTRFRYDFPFKFKYKRNLGGEAPEQPAPAPE
jgi:hypothetical protein